MNWDAAWPIIFQVATVLGVSEILRKTWTRVRRSKVIDAEGTKVVSDTVLAQLSSMNERLRRTEGQLDEFRARVELHVRWDFDRIEQLVRLGVQDIPPAPRLWVNDKDEQHSQAR